MHFIRSCLKAQVDVLHINVSLGKMCEGKDHLLPFATESWWLVRRGQQKEGGEKRKTSEVLYQTGVS